MIAEVMVCLEHGPEATKGCLAGACELSPGWLVSQDEALPVVSLGSKDDRRYMMFPIPEDSRHITAPTK